MVETFAHVPRAAKRFCLVLKIPAGQVHAGGIPIDSIQGRAGRDIPAARAECDNQFHFVMKIIRGGGERDGIAHNDRVGWFREKERRLAIRVSAHFSGVCGIIAPDAENPSMGKNPPPITGTAGVAGGAITKSGISVSYLSCERLEHFPIHPDRMML